MENTTTMRFKDQTPKWFVAIGSESMGPMTAAEVYQKVEQGELTWVHYIWTPGAKDWKRICDEETFKAAMPAPPKQEIKEQVAEQVRPEVRKVKSRPVAPPPPEDDKPWFIYQEHTQYGPFQIEEILRQLEVGSITTRTHVWQEGRTGWERLERVEEFQAALRPKVAAPPPPPDEDSGELELQTKTSTRKVQPPPKPSAAERRAEKREAPRAPLMAKIFLTNEDTVITGLCRDISIGGMQILTDRIPGAVGTKIKLNVIPSDTPKVKPFVAKGVIVRVLEDGRGFSFRFEKLEARTRGAIESYIEEL